MSRNVFDELVEGFDALAEARQGKRTLRSHAVSAAELPDITSQELIQIRENLNMSQGVFAQYLRTNKRTLENWEQGRSKPNAQAQTLIRLVKRHPETIEYLAELE
ncbi:helix-turn-helix domain-containing protein [Halomonas sp. McH1-25]|uniref:helix-turn-helix domain-containing protein n=1 Tax=unclassified Halomonas TaxID=2609666 RepID=UPI001EF40124|nr:MULTISPECIES: helix-turn-helix domain-containing protein [unclassified Halomonas]MCG7601798.1 helix-turn-helix domain-containing protein [Halomonas sp. McH1-25]MCP1343974.1 helix-turn-helix domain-containing protein [Halomonas sp. FL8]MCP1361793.1 helix-turn-helix domain-containing protein [Halomonas sp. BBD45]MCP1364937.1 helix-turn-helix domain-containing protein [Halomonas sp. BBD48]